MEGNGRKFKVALLTHGSRGDTQPMVVLALALLKKGIEPTICACGDHGDFVTRFPGLESSFVGWTVTARELFEATKEWVVGSYSDISTVC